MALNRHMHERNIYKNPPDFSKLANTYMEFANVAKRDITGKITLDFKNSNTLRILTKCLLKSDFNLDVHIPEDRLVPTLPLRLNYVLWIEDMLNSIDRQDDIRGLDIGTGACAIYPLLAAVKNKWHMVGTETDEESLQKAQDNVKRNNLQELIELVKNPTKTIIQYLFTSEYSKNFEFCMCNPPFYSNFQELCDSRSPARPPPKNGFTGSPQELITEGGELQFCRKLLKESKDYKDKVKIFTTMVGHKYNLTELLQDLKAEGIKHTNTEFCQGRVTRWGLAWTYQDYDLYKLVPPREKLRKKNTPITYLLPELTNSHHDVESVTNKIKSILNDLKISHKILNKRGNHICLDILATINTWSHQRRKKRHMKRLEACEGKKQKLEGEMQDTSTSDGHNSSEISEKSTDDINPSQNNFSESHKSSTSEGNLYITNSEPIVHAFVKIFKKDDNIVLQMEFLDGNAGKEGLHQILQYIKNNWK